MIENSLLHKLWLFSFDNRDYHSALHYNIGKIMQQIIKIEKLQTEVIRLFGLAVILHITYSKNLVSIFRNYYYYRQFFFRLSRVLQDSVLLLGCFVFIYKNDHGQAGSSDTVQPRQDMYFNFMYNIALHRLFFNLYFCIFYKIKIIIHFHLTNIF